jgi:DNA processing protein
MHNCSPEAFACLALQTIPRLGDVGVRSLVESHGSANAALTSVSAAVAAAARESAARSLQAAERAGAHVVAITDTHYPPRLRELRDAPAVLFARGSLHSAAPPAVAIVGTRTASGYGLRVAKAIATACARAGISVISGLARGIDAAAHEAALAAGGRTVAVLGTGIDIVYPKSHRLLQERIAHEGLVLSEQVPGDAGHAGTFPRRNRLIAALADITVVVEAGEGSGALITADHAVELGRTVACVPNAIDVATARGSNALLKAHAEPILAPDDVLRLLDMTPAPTHGPALDGVSAQCWDAVQRGAQTPGDVARHTGLSTRDATAVLALLEIDGLLAFDPAGRIRPTLLGA